MRVAITGASGFIGSALCGLLERSGHTTTRVVRTTPRDGEVRWDPAQGTIDRAGLEGHDAIVHLAGESIAARWTPEKRAAILQSRVLGTRLIAETIAGLSHPPRVLLSASAIGYYGDRDDELLDETAAPGSDFLADVCQQWESATAAARAGGIRVVALRTGIVLSTKGGALAKMITPFRFGVGGRLGDGKQWMSWILLEDLIGAALHILNHEQLVGPVNGVAPNPARNGEFTRALARVLHRPAILPMPAVAVRALFGEMGDALLLSSARVRPTKLLGSGYEFQAADLERALERLLVG